MCRDKTIIGLSQKFIAVVKFLFYISSVSFESIFKSNLVHASFVSSNSDFFYYLLNVSCTFKSLSAVIKSNKTITQYSLYLSSLNLSLSLRDRADTIITFHPPTTTPRKLFKCLIGDLYSSAIHHWNRQLKPYSFSLRKNRVNQGHL